MIARLDLHLPRYAAQLAARHWPGPLTLVLPGGEGRVPQRVARSRRAASPCGGRRIRACSGCFRAHGDPITSTSANRPGVPPAMTAAEIVEQWSEAIARGVLRVLDGGRWTPSIAVDGGRLHWAAAARHSARRDRAATAARKRPGPRR